MQDKATAMQDKATAVEDILLDSNRRQNQTNDGLRQPSQGGLIR